MAVHIDSEPLKQQGYVDVAMSWTGQVIRVQNPQVHDDLHSYTIQFLQQYLHFAEFQDGIREGDPFHTKVNLKRRIPFFHGHSARSKYAIECIDYILKTDIMLPEPLAMRVRLGSFVNPHGQPRGNKPDDMQQENNILVLKDLNQDTGCWKD